MPVPKAQQHAVNRYIRRNYDRINTTLKKGSKSLIEAAAKENNDSINGYIKKAIKAKYEADTGRTIDL